MSRTYVWVTAEDEEGNDRVLLEHFGDKGVRTRVYEADEIENIRAWDIASKLNAAYEAGRNHAMEDLRRFIGIKDWS